jgi:ATP-dependent RNA helicase HelY
MSKDKKPYRRTAKTRSRRRIHGRVKTVGRSSPHRQAHYGKPRIDPELRPIFRKIGVPEPEPFKADPFQLEALERIKDYDVLVSAATGSGKTWIASQAIQSCLIKGLNVWYASPLKALSNSIYQQFCHEFGPSNCGILTGDRKENARAPVIVGTTEILRNQLYDAMHEGTGIRADFVILDEAHYLSDPDRGVVWEEVLIYLPSSVRLLLLSATVSNAEEICEWLREIRGVPNRIVRSEERPVPLKMLFLFNEGLIVPLTGKKGLAPKVKKFLASRSGGWRRWKKPHYGIIIKQLRELDLLPAIFFLKSRSDCDQAIFTCLPSDIAPRINASLKRATNAFLRDFPHLVGHRQMGPLLKSRVGSHHGGQLPYWKALIEKMMSKGYLEAIFSTSTVAAGVNFPARTVVLVQSDRYNGHEFADLTATDFHQMIGRAGRRGMDRIGFGVVIPGIHQDPQLLSELNNAPPEPLLSQLHINFSMTLNLLLSHTPLEVRDLIGLSFASFQERETGAFVKRRWDELISKLKKTLPGGKCDTTDPYEILENIQKRGEVKKEVRQLSRNIRYKRLINTYREYLRPGRFFLHKNGSRYMVSQTLTDQGKLICLSLKITKTAWKKRQHLRLKRIDINQIKAIYNYQIEFSESFPIESLDRLFDTIELDDLEILNFKNSDQDTGTGGERLDKIKEQFGVVPCESCAHVKICHGKEKPPLIKLLRDLKVLGMQMEGMGGGLWLSFKRHVRFLQETGFVDQANRLTPDGHWASKLRLDQPLLIAEAIRRGGFNSVSPPIMAGALAPFVWDRTLELEPMVDGIFNLTDVKEQFNKIMNHIENIKKLKSKRGFDSCPILFWPAAALFMWARKIPWEQLLTYVPVNEGDMASLIMRTADHLRQVINLKDTHPQLADGATNAIKLILREPVYID